MLTKYFEEEEISRKNQMNVPQVSYHIELKKDAKWTQALRRYEYLKKGSLVHKAPATMGFEEG